jgi:predicted Zn-dependent peptidase
LIDEAKKAVQDYYGSIPRGKEIVRTYTQEPQQTEERYTEVTEKQTPLPAVSYSWRTVAEGDKDVYPLDLLTNVLARGNSSRLIKRLQDKDELIVSLQPLAYNMEKDGIIGFLAVAKSGIEVSQIRAALDDEIAKIIKDGISDEEFQKTKNQMVKDLVTQAASIQSVAFGLSHMYTIFKDTKRFNSEAEKYNAVTKADIQHVAKKYLTKETRNVLVYTVPKAN